MKPNVSIANIMEDLILHEKLFSLEEVFENYFTPILFSCGDERQDPRRKQRGAQPQTILSGPEVGFHLQWIQNPFILPETRNIFYQDPTLDPMKKVPDPASQKSTYPNGSGSSSLHFTPDIRIHIRDKCFRLSKYPRLSNLLIY